MIKAHGLPILKNVDLARFRMYRKEIKSTCKNQGIYFLVSYRLASTVLRLRWLIIENCGLPTLSQCSIIVHSKQKHFCKTFLCENFEMVKRGRSKIYTVPFRTRFLDSSCLQPCIAFSQSSKNKSNVIIFLSIR